MIQLSLFPEIAIIRGKPPTREMGKIPFPILEPDEMVEIWDMALKRWRMAVVIGFRNKYLYWHISQGIDGGYLPHRGNFREAGTQ